MAKITVDYEQTGGVIDKNQIDAMQEEVNAAHNKLHGESGDFLGWVEWPESYAKSEEFARIKEAAEKIKRTSEVLVVIGIGGSYLGARAVIEALNHNFYNLLSSAERKSPQILYAGNNISAKYLRDLLGLIQNKKVSLNVISKSGTTTEPAVAFRILKDFMKKKYGREASKRIYATTDGGKGALLELAEAQGYERFIVPDNIGGRYSVLTAVGLLPIAASGIDITELLAGAKDGVGDFAGPGIGDNPAYEYAAIRNLLYRRGKKIEILANFEPNLLYFSEWWKQLFGESEGKDGKGIFPVAAAYSADLHSMGQYIQEGERHLFETFINIEQPLADLSINSTEDNLDGLNYLAGKDVDSINKKVYEAVRKAHTIGGVPDISINVPALDEFNLGKLIYFFEKACGLSGHLLGVDPFNQPGVEVYKKNMFTLLGKPE